MLIGSVAAEKMEDTAVHATDRPRSAFMMEHHQLDRVAAAAQTGRAWRPQYRAGTGHGSYSSSANPLCSRGSTPARTVAPSSPTPTSRPSRTRALTEVGGRPDRGALPPPGVSLDFHAYKI
eukprot:scaffold1236_cov116-Isochrysis_galbana.AAC.3